MEEIILLFIGMYAISIGVITSQLAMRDTYKNRFWKVGAVVSAFIIGVVLSPFITALKLFSDKLYGTKSNS